MRSKCFCASCGLAALAASGVKASMILGTRVKAVTPRRYAAALGRQTRNGSNEVVGCQCDVYFFGHHVWRGATEVFQLECALQGTQIGFIVPAQNVETHEFG